MIRRFLEAITVATVLSLADSTGAVESAVTMEPAAEHEPDLKEIAPASDASVALSAEGAEAAAAPPTVPREAIVPSSDAPETSSISQRIADAAVEEYDPWEPFNTSMFSFNRKVDRYVLKPVAKAWDTVMPTPVERSLKNAFDNLAVPRRLVNNLLQLRFKGAGTELARFGLNTTIGLAGLFDVAKALGIQPSDADTGQTLGIYGVGHGPYLVLPLLPPLTVRDGVGFVLDAALDPFNYVLFPVAALAGNAAGKRVDERALNLDLYETVEEGTVDLYSAVRNAYLQRRQQAIERDSIGP